MKTFAITGGICCGKTTVLNALSKKFPTLSCDSIIAKLYEKQEIQAKIQNLLKHKTFEKRLVLEEILQKPSLLPKIEKILYPHLHKKIQEFVQFHRKKRTKAIFIEIPLLFEKNLHHFYDCIILIASNKQRRLKNFKNRSPNTQIFHTFNKLQFSDAKKLYLTQKNGGKVLSIHNIKGVKGAIANLITF